MLREIDLTVVKNVSIVVQRFFRYAFFQPMLLLRLVHFGKRCKSFIPLRTVKRSEIACIEVLSFMKD